MLVLVLFTRGVCHELSAGNLTGGCCCLPDKCVMTR